MGRIVKNARVLTADYLPNRMVHRDGERQEIARCLRPILEEGQPVDMLLYGKPGTGKTTMAQYVVEELQKKEFVQSSYVNCFSEKSRFEIFYELLDEKVKMPRDGTSTQKIIDHFEQKTREDPTVVIIDEVDQISNDETLYELSRFHNIGKIFIANDPQVFSHFEDRVRSRLSGTNPIEFKRYNEEQLKDILKLRRKYGLRKDSVDNKVLHLIAKRSGGDARVALNSLRIAARKAESQDTEKITKNIVDSSISKAYEKEQLHSLESLNKHQKAAYKIVQEKGDVQIGELYQEYYERVEDPKSRRQILRYLNKMVTYNLLQKQGSKSSTKYKLED